MNTQNFFKSLFNQPGRTVLRSAVLASLIFVLVLAGCAVKNNTTATPDPALVQTLVAQTLAAMPTQTGPTDVQPTPLKPVDQPTATQVPPTATQVPPTATQVPTATLVPTATQTPVPTATPVPPTATPIPCGRATFVKDVNFPDGTVFSPGTHFSKTWRVKNAGSCTWNKNYSIIFSSGDRMSGAQSTAFVGNVAPGATVDLAVHMIAPATNGTYQGYWMLKTDNGVIFGVGAESTTALWVKIKVVTPTTRAYDFITNMCSASWRNGSAALPCPGTVGSAAGSVTKVDNPAMETGGTDDEAALRVEPQVVDNGLVMGKYPEFSVQTGDHFMAVIGCWSGMTKCNVMFQLNYQIGGGAVTNLKTWTEVFDKQINHLDVDLSSLAGQKVTFILSVSANGAAEQDSAFWLQPRIMR